MMKSKNIKILSSSNYNTKSLEYQLIEYVNKFPLSIVENPINVISKKLYVNVSTLTRTVRKIGFENYKNFRNFVTKKIVEHKEYLFDIDNQETDNLLRNSINCNILTIKETIESNNNSKFDEIIDEIVNAKKIFLFGIGFTYFICQHLTKYLEFSNINCCNNLNFYDAMQFSITSVDNLWIIISITLKTREMIFLLKELISNKKNKIIVITANYTNPILEKVSYVLKLKPANRENELFNLNSKLALTALINLVILKVLNKINHNKIKQILNSEKKQRNDKIGTEKKNK